MFPQNCFLSHWIRLPVSGALDIKILFLIDPLIYATLWYFVAECIPNHVASMVSEANMHIYFCLVSWILFTNYGGIFSRRL